jgi:hypothetical protein
VKEKRRISPARTMNNTHSRFSHEMVVRAAATVFT